MDFTELLRDAVTIIAVLGLLAGALHLARKRGFVMGGSPQSSRLIVVGRIGLTPTHSLHLVQTDRGTILIATHQGGCTLIEQAALDEEKIGSEVRQVGAQCGS